MKNKIHLFVLVAALLIWGLVSIDWFVCQIRGECKIKDKPIAKQITQETFEKIYFAKGSPIPKFDSKLEEVYPEVETMTQEKVMMPQFIIVGRAYPDSIPGEGEAVALQRAEATKELFKKYPWYNDIELKTEIIDADFKYEKYDKYFQATRFELKEVTKIEGIKIVGQTIYFGFGETDPSKSDKVAAFLEKMAERSAESQKPSIVIEGHTDSLGDATANKNLGLNRARTISDMLQAMGVSRSAITSVSFGEEQPASDNETEKGRQLNRRVEIKTNF